VTDAVTILAIVVLKGVLGFLQEWKAERAIEVEVKSVFGFLQRNY